MIRNSLLQQNVIDELTWDPSVDATHVDVAVHDGIVTLTGYVNSYFEKKKCEQIAKRIARVKAVVDEIDLKLAGIAKRGDLEIAEAAVNALKLNVLIPQDSIKITVEKGWIVLDGEVDWQYQSNAAEFALRTMIGIKGISNKIHVRPSVSAADVKSKIQSALMRNAQIDSNNIAVDIKGGTAILRGHVRSWAEREQAETATWSAPGIVKVENEVIVEL